MRKIKITGYTKSDIDYMLYTTRPGFEYEIPIHRGAALFGFSYKDLRDGMAYLSYYPLKKKDIIKILFNS